MIKKTIVEGRVVKQAFTSLLAVLHNFFETKEVEAPNIIFGTPAYRKYREDIKTKKVVWHAVSSGEDKQAIFEARSKKQMARGGLL